MARILIVLILVSIETALSVTPYDVYYKWKMIDYNFPSDAQRTQQINSGKYIPKNNIIQSIRVYKNRMFLTTPRYGNGVPSALNVIPYHSTFSVGSNVSPLLDPYPSWSMQEEGNCSAFQLIESIEIDQFHRLWLIDIGRTNILGEKPNNYCPARLQIYKLNAKRHRDKLIFSYTFPSSVVNPNKTALKDMQVVCKSKNNCWVYISDTLDYKLVVFDYKRRTSWFAQHASMNPDPKWGKFDIDGTPINVGAFGIAGSAVSPKCQNYATFYYSPIAGIKIFAVQTQVLQKARSNFNLTNFQVQTIGTRNGPCDGWKMDNRGLLYFANFLKNSIDFTETFGQKKIKKIQTYLRSDEDLVYANDFTVDKEGHLLVNTCRPQEFSFRVNGQSSASSSFQEDYSLSEIVTIHHPCTGCQIFHVRSSSSNKTKIEHKNFLVKVHNSMYGRLL